MYSRMENVKFVEDSLVLRKQTRLDRISLLNFTWSIHEHIVLYNLCSYSIASF